MEINQVRLKEVLKYNPDAGVFIWIERKRGRKFGRTAGTVNSSNGYTYIQIDGERYLVHRLVWLYVHGYFPAGNKPFIDHIDGNPSNNRLENIRESSHSENQRNQKKHSRNTSGINGVNREACLNGTKTKVNYYWVAAWCDNFGKFCRKYFSIEKLGEEQAKCLATTHRAKQISLLESEHGVMYSSRHGC